MVAANIFDSCSGMTRSASPHQFNSLVTSWKNSELTYGVSNRKHPQDLPLILPGMIPIEQSDSKRIWSVAAPTEILAVFVLHGFG
jgi:hypothetical protein